MQPKKVHFICRGNTYRSRLAEAYVKSLKLPGYQISSSGIDGGEYPEHQIEWYTTMLAQQHDIDGNLSKQKRQTTQKLLDDNDILVFMSKDVYDDASKHLDFDARKTVIWHFQDIDQRVHTAGVTMRNRGMIQELSEDTFQKIAVDCRKLSRYLTGTSWADIYDATNHPTGLRLPVAWANDRGLWRRSVHIVISTPEKRYLIEKRSKTIVFAPGYLDVSLGGGVDCGETPRQAALRETKEELGIEVKPGQLRLLDVRRWSSYHPHYHKYSRTFVYTYHAVVHKDQLTLKLQDSEVASAQMISGMRLNTLLRTHRLRHVGKLNSGYKYYQRIIRLSQHPPRAKAKVK